MFSLFSLAIYMFAFLADVVVVGDGDGGGGGDWGGGSNISAIINSWCDISLPHLDYRHFQPGNT